MNSTERKLERVKEKFTEWNINREHYIFSSSFVL